MWKGFDCWNQNQDHFGCARECLSLYTDQSCRCRYEPRWFVGRQRRRNRLHHQQGYVCLCSACLCTHVGHIHGLFLCFLSSFPFGDVNSAILPVFHIRHLLCSTEVEMEVQNPSSVLGHGLFHTSCRQCPGIHGPESTPSTRLGHGLRNVPEPGTVVFTLFKWTGLWGHVGSDQDPGA